MAMAIAMAMAMAIAIALDLAAAMSVAMATAAGVLRAGVARIAGIRAMADSDMPAMCIVADEAAAGMHLDDDAVKPELVVIEAPLRRHTVALLQPRTAWDGAPLRRQRAGRPHRGPHARLLQGARELQPPGSPVMPALGGARRPGQRLA